MKEVQRKGGAGGRGRDGRTLKTCCLSNGIELDGASGLIWRGEGDCEGIEVGRGGKRRCKKARGQEFNQKSPVQSSRAPQHQWKREKGKCEAREKVKRGGGTALTDPLTN